MVKMEIPDLKNMKSLEKACRTLGLEIDMTKKSAKYYAGSQMKCDGVIKCPGSQYEIALTKEDNGSYSVKMDNYDPTLSAKVGSSAGKLSQAYQIEEHKRAARNAGKEIVGHKVEDNGTITLKIRA